MRAVSANSRAITVPPGTLPPRRRRPRLSELATPLGATFLGVLLVHGLMPVGDARAAETGGTGSDGDGVDPLTDGANVASTMALPEALPGSPSSAAGSVISIGSLIDLAALTQLSGDARFAETVLGQAGATPPPTPTFLNDAAHAVASGTAPGATFLALADEPLPILPEAETPADDQAAPPIGTYAKAGDGGGTINGTGDADVLLGGTGTDTLNAGGGNDTIEGGSGDDVLNLGSGDDFARGDDGCRRSERRRWQRPAVRRRRQRHSRRRCRQRRAGGRRRRRYGSWAGPGFISLQGGAGSDTYVIDHVADRAVDLPASTDGGIDTLEIAPGYASSLKLALPALAPQGAATFVFGTPDPLTFPSGLHEFSPAGRHRHRKYPPARRCQPRCRGRCGG